MGVSSDWNGQGRDDGFSDAIGEGWRLRGCWLQSAGSDFWRTRVEVEPTVQRQDGSGESSWWVHTPPELFVPVCITIENLSSLHGLFAVPRLR